MEKDNQELDFSGFQERKLENQVPLYLTDEEWERWNKLEEYQKEDIYDCLYMEFCRMLDVVEEDEE